MSSRSKESSSKTKTVYNQFLPALGPNDYTVDNLDNFIKSAGSQEVAQFNKEFEAEKRKLNDEYLRANGVDPYQYSGVNLTALDGDELLDYNEWNRRVSELKKLLVHTNVYRNALRQFRYDRVLKLDRAGKLVPLDQVSKAQAVSSGLSRGISQKVVEDKGNTEGPQALFDWVSQQSPLAFNANALEEVARRLKVKGFSNIKTKGDQRKIDLYNLIMGNTGATTSTRVPTQMATTLLGELENRGITSVGQMDALRVDDLRALTKRYGIQVKSGARKAVLIDAIAMAAGLDSMRPLSNIEADIDSIIQLALTDPIRAREQGRSLDPNELGQVSVKKMKQLFDALRLRKELNERDGKSRTGSPSRDLIIQILTGSRTARSLSRQEDKSIKSDRNTCLNSSEEDVNRIAKGLKIVTLGLSKEHICDRIYAYYLGNMSQRLISRGADLEGLARLPQDKQRAEVRKLANTLKINGNVDSVDDLLRMWVDAHYLAKVLTLYPSKEGILRNYLERGTIPDVPSDVDILASLVSDANRGITTMDDEGKRAALRVFYNQFIQRVQQGGARSIGTFLANLGKYGFGSEYTEGSPLREYVNANATREEIPPVSLVRQNGNNGRSRSGSMNGNARPLVSQNGNARVSPRARSPVRNATTSYMNNGTFQMPPPTEEDFGSLIGNGNYSKQFIPDFADI